MFYQPYDNYLEDSKDMGVAFCINYFLEFLRIFFYKLFVKYRIVFLKHAKSNSPGNSLSLSTIHKFYTASFFNNHEVIEAAMMLHN